MTPLVLPIALLCATPDSVLPDTVALRQPVVAARVGTPALRLGPARGRAGCFFTYGVITRNRPEHHENYLNHEAREELRESFPTFHTRIDNYTRHAPTAAVYVLPLLGMKGHYNAANFTLLYLAGRALNDGLTNQLKKRVGEVRPGEEPDNRSFPSAHTSEAFFSATLLYEQYRDRSPWIGAAGFAVAGATGAMRMLNDKHWLSDVVAGAGIGIFSAEMAWHAYPWLQRRLVLPVAKKLMLAPVVGTRTAGLAVAIRP